jgi:hypothetical protein
MGWLGVYEPGSHPMAPPRFLWGEWVVAGWVQLTHASSTPEGGWGEGSVTGCHPATREGHLLTLNDGWLLRMLAGYW